MISNTRRYLFIESLGLWCWKSGISYIPLTGVALGLMKIVFNTNKIIIVLPALAWQTLKDSIVLSIFNPASICLSCLGRNFWPKTIWNYGCCVWSVTWPNSIIVQWCSSKAFKYSCKGSLLFESLNNTKSGSYNATKEAI